jgi:ABC-type uncharacterized transport system substrate-binding protein
MYSSGTLFDFDKNSNGKLDPSESKSIVSGALKNLGELEFFTHIKIKGKKFPVKSVKDFSAKMEGEKLVYNFFVPCQVKATKSLQNVNLAVYDNTYYSDIGLTRINPVAYENNNEYEVKHKVVTNKKEAFYYNQVYPREIIISFKRKDV